ncbi:MAG: hypothetical protein Kow00127_13810 [Bacteroidales bacterium]
MKGIRAFLLAATLIIPVIINAQEQAIPQGKISYVSSANVYVKFSSTEGLKAGDTLFVPVNGQKKPALVVESLSSISALCTPIGDMQLSVGTTVVAPSVTVAATQEKSESEEPTAEMIPADTTVARTDTVKPLWEERIRGKVKVASYSNFSNTGAPFSQRMRYTLSFDGEHLKGSGLSVESYLSYVHSNLDWNEIENNFFNGLKVYDLNVRYDFQEKGYLLAGRKVNPRVANIGAMDGIQGAWNLGKFKAGALVGSRPDYSNYGVNLNLLQYGAWVGWDVSNTSGSGQTTVAFMQQTNNGHTDRRFLYLQHSNNLVKNLYLFGSAELDLYKTDLNYTGAGDFRLTNLYLMTRYRPVRQFSVSLSYSARNNIIYYETNKDYLERLLDNELRQGWRLNIQYRPVRLLTLGVTGGYRFRPNDPNPNRNLYAYASVSRIPGIGGYATASYTRLETAYLNGNIYGLRFNKDLKPGKVTAGLGYRFVDYAYRDFNIDIRQHMPEASLTWRIIRKLSLGLFWEGTFENPDAYQRVYANLAWRF